MNYIHVEGIFSEWFLYDNFDTTFQMETAPFQTIGTLAGLTVVTAKSLSTNQTLVLCLAGQ